MNNRFFQNINLYVKTENKLADLMLDEIVTNTKVKSVLSLVAHKIKTVILA